MKYKCPLNFFKKCAAILIHFLKAEHKIEMVRRSQSVLLNNWHLHRVTHSLWDTVWFIIERFEGQMQMLPHTDPSSSTELWSLL